MRRFKGLLTGVLGMLILPSVISASTTGTVGPVIVGYNAFGTDVGVTGAVQVGNNFESGQTLEDVVGQGGNAITIRMSDELAATANFFTMTVGNTAGGSPCSSPGTQFVFLNAPNKQQLCAQIHAGINQGCSMRPANDPIGDFDVVGPFNCLVTHWAFQAGTVPARASWVAISGVTNTEAGEVDHFQMNHNGTIISSQANTFDAVTNGAQLASAIGGLSGLIRASYAGDTITITSNATGPNSYSGIELQTITPAIPSTVTISNIGTAQAAAINAISIRIAGVQVNDSVVNYAAATNLAQLAVELNKISLINVQTSGPEALKIDTASAGLIQMSEIALIVRPELTTSPGPVGMLENSNVTVDPGLGAFHGLGSTITGAHISVSPFSDGDGISFSPVASIEGLNAFGVMALQGDATSASYQQALRSVVYSSTSDTPPPSVTVSFYISDSLHRSNTVSRVVNITPQNDAPVAAIGSSTLDYQEGDSLPVAPLADISDVDSAMIASATISISSGYRDAEDTLEFVSQDGISGAFAGGMLQIGGPATPAQFQQFIRGVSYRNLSQNPNESPRTLSFSVNDGDMSSAVKFRSMTVTGVNDMAELETSYGQVDYALLQLIGIDDGLTIEDIDSPELASARVWISGGFNTGQDWLRFNAQNGISGDYDDITGVLSLGGVSSLENYVTALRSIAFENTSHSPNLSLRSVSFEVNDGDDASNTATRQIRMPLLVDGFESEPGD